jgi:nucleotide-binding universal stress UspA family protein
MIARVILPLDGTARAEAALAPAASLLGTSRGEALLVHVLAGSDPVERRRAAAYLARTATRLRGRGIRVKTRVLRGPPPAAVVRLARRSGADLIALASRGSGSAGPWPLGSVAREILRTAPIPVLLVRGASSKPFRRVIVRLGTPAESLAVMAFVGELAGSVRTSVALLAAGRASRESVDRAVDVLARLGIPSRLCRRSGPADLVALAVPKSRRALDSVVAGSTRSLLLVRASVAGM